MPDPHAPSATSRSIIAALAATPRIDNLAPIAARFVYSLRLIALHERLGRDPVPELAVRLRSVEAAAKALILAQAISAIWPENIHVSRFCCGLLSHDEVTIGAIVDSAERADRRAFEGAVDGLIRSDRAHRLWHAALALVAAEQRAA